MQKVILLIILSFSILVFGGFFEDAIEEKLGKSEASLIFYVVSWCPNSNKALPAFKRVKEKLKKKYFVEIVDCKIYEEYCKQKEIGSYPNINIYKRNLRKRYEDEKKDLNSIVKWFEKNAVFFGTDLKNKQEIEKFKTNNKKYVIGYFPQGVTDRFRLYDSVANGYLSGKFEFGVIRDAKNIEGGSREEKIIVYNGENEITLRKKDYSHLNTKNLTDLIFDKSFELVGEMTKQSFQEYRSRRKDLYLSFIETSNPQVKQFYLDTIKELALKYPQFSFGYIPFEGNMDVVEQFEIPNSLPQSIVRYNFFDNIDDLFYSPPRPFTFEEISLWIKAINPSIQSQTPPQKASPTIKTNQHEEL